MFRRRSVEAPENVRLILRDGSEIGVEVAYRGLDPLGFHEWEVTSLVDPELAVGIRCELVPAKTVISLRMTRPPW